MLGKDAVLLVVGQAAKQWGDLNAAPLARLDGLLRVADIALAGEEAEDVAFSFCHELLDGLAQAV